MSAARQPFNAKKARTKYACPMWVDAFLRDTLELEADEFGAYHLIVYAMWSREACNMPDDDRKMARVTRCSTRLWRSRIRPALEPFFEVENGFWTSTRLQKEAVKTEKFLKEQSNRRRGGDIKSSTYTFPEGEYEHSQENEINSDNSLKSNNPGVTGDRTTDTTGDRPTQESKRPIIGGRDHSAGARKDDREAILTAIGADPISGMVGPNGKQIGRMADMQEARRWRDDLDLTLNEVLSVIAEVMAKKTDGPPSTFSYFTAAMQRHAGVKSKPTLTPIEGGQSERANSGNQHARGPHTAAGRAHQNLVAAFAGTIPDER